MQGFAPTYSERLLLRRLEIGDAEALFAYRSLPEICRYQTWQPEKVADAAEFITNKIVATPNLPGTWFQLALCLRLGGKMIGDVGIHFLPEADQVELGYTLHPQYQRKGYAFEALTAVGDYLRSLQKHRIIATVDPNNVPSIRLLEKWGAKRAQGQSSGPCADQDVVFYKALR